MSDVRGLELDVISDGFAAVCDEETGMKYVNEPQGAAESVADVRCPWPGTGRHLRWVCRRL
uniref:Uncharacterized protein n=1 Tax=Oryza brachyantha TaxID=4533 RepID=J3LQ50_ORYBR